MKYDFATLYLLESDHRAAKQMGFLEENPLDVYAGICEALPDNADWIVPNLHNDIVALFICPPGTKQNWIHLDQEYKTLIKTFSGRYTIMKFYPVRMDGVYYMVVETELSAVPHIIGINQMGIDHAFAESVPEGFPCAYIQCEDSDNLAFTTFDYDPAKAVDSRAVLKLFTNVQGYLQVAEAANDLYATVTKLLKRLPKVTEQLQAILGLGVNEYIQFKPENKSEETSLFSQQGSAGTVGSPIATFTYDGTKDMYVHRVAVGLKEDPFVALAEAWGWTKVSQPVSDPYAVNAFTDSNKAVHYVIAW